MSDPTQSMAAHPPPPPLDVPGDGDEPPRPWWTRRVPIWVVLLVGLVCLLVGTASAATDEGEDDEVAAGDAVSADSPSDGADVEALTAEIEELEKRLAERNDDVTSLQNALEKSRTTSAPPATTTTTTAPPATAPPTSADASGGETASQRNARQKAADYLDLTAFSRSGLIDQLVFEGFPQADATYGVDDLGADWNEQAAKKAAEYLSLTSFSRSGLIDQLVFEGFSQAQAEYGVGTTGL